MDALTEDPDDLPREWGPLYQRPASPRPLRDPLELIAELGRPLTEVEKVNLLDEGEVIRAIAQGASVSSICRDLGIAWWTLNRWLRSTPQRQSLYEEARRIAATMFEERAEEVLMTAPPTLAELTRAKAIAALLQRRAQTHDPTLYGDKAQVAITHDVIGELKARIHAAGGGLPMAPPPLVKRLSDSASD